MQVEGGIPLQICLSRFTRWLQNLQLNMGVTFPSKQKSSAPTASQKLCTFLTWSGKRLFFNHCYHFDTLWVSALGTLVSCK